MWHSEMCIILNQTSGFAATARQKSLAEDVQSIVGSSADISNLYAVKLPQKPEHFPITLTASK